MQRIISFLIVPVALAFIVFFLYRSNTFQDRSPTSPRDLTPIRADTLSVADTDADVETALSTLRDLYTDLLSRFDSFTQSSSAPSSSSQTTVYAPSPTPILDITSIPYRSHSSLTNLTNSDDHTQYLYGSGRAGGQTLVGGIHANDILTLQSSSATTGISSTEKALKIIVGSGGETEALTILNNGYIGIGISTPTTALDIAGTLKTTGLTFPTGAVAGYVLTTDANGVASWTDVSSSAGPWSLTGNNLYPDSTSNNLAIGASDAGSAKLYVNGNVGIGTTAPGYGLDVAGTGRFTGALTLGTVASVADNNVILTTDSGTVKYTDSSAWDKNAGDDVTTFLGLTDAPSDYSSKGLKVVRVNSGETGLEFADLALDTNYFKQGGNSLSALASLGTNDTYGLAFKTNNTERVRIDASGNVGIGTTSPGAKLDIGGYATSNLQAIFTRGTSDLNFRLTAYNGSGSAANTEQSWFGMDYNGAKTSGISFIRGSGANGWMSFQTNTGTDAVAIDTLGNVGIGTTGPLQTLDVKGKFFVDANGRVGIGTQPDSNYGFTVDTGIAHERIKIHGSTSSGFYLMNPAGTDGATVRTDATAFQIYPTNSAAAVTILNSNGNVGIGTTAPGGKLVIKGAGTTTGIGFQTQNSSGTALVTMLDSGNVGIGTTAPGLALDVVGNARFSAVGSGATANDLRLTSNGTLTTDTSDVSLKTNIEGLGGTLDKMLHLNPVSFNWLANPTGRKELGLIAQEVAPIFPELTFTNPVDGKMGINYSRIPTLLIKAMQEQQGYITALESAVHGISADTKIASMSSELTQLTTKTSVWDTLTQQIQSLIVALQAQLGLVRTDLDATKDQVASLSASLNSMNVDYTSWKEAITSGSGLLGASTSAMLDKVATISSLLVKNDLEVGGKTSTFDLTVLNKLTSGIIEIGAGVSGDEINSVGGIRFQTLAQGPIDFMNGKVVIDVDGSIKAKHLKLDTADPSSSTAGTAVLEAGKTTIQVVTTSIGPDSLVFITPITLTDIPIAVTQRSPGVGFTATISQTITKDLEFQWLVIN